MAEPPKNFLAFAPKDAVHHNFVRRPETSRFEPADQYAARIAEIDKHLKKLDAEVSSPNIKEINHHELAALHRQLDRERAYLRVK